MIEGSKKNFELMAGEIFTTGAGENPDAPTSPVNINLDNTFTPNIGGGKGKTQLDS